MAASLGILSSPAPLLSLTCLVATPSVGRNLGVFFGLLLASVMLGAAMAGNKASPKFVGFMFLVLGAFGAYAGIKITGMDGAIQPVGAPGGAGTRGSKAAGGKPATSRSGASASARTEAAAERLSIKSLILVLGALVVIVYGSLTLAYPRVVGPPPKAKVIRPPTSPLPAVSAECAAMLNAGRWEAPEGILAHGDIDPLQIGLSDSAARVWHWSFGAAKTCGFGVKSTAAVADSVMGRWLLFVGDSQARMVYRRLVESVAPVLTTKFSAPTLNGEKVSDPTAEPLLGHQDFELVWTAPGMDMPTR